MISRVALLSLTVIAAMLALPGAVSAQSDDAIGYGDVLNELRALREENREMRAEMDELRAMNDDGWLTERRADEIRGLVYDVLADADTRSSLQATGMTAGWDDNFFIASHDGRFRLQLDGQIQFRWIYNYLDDDRPFDRRDRHRHGFENSRTKLTFRGHVFNPDWTYLVRGDFARAGGNFTLQDAFMRFHLNDHWSIRAGQFKLPFNREELVDSKYQQAVERSIVNEGLNLGRSQGVEITWEDMDDRVAFSISDGGGPLNTGLVGVTGVNSPALNVDSEYTLNLRYEKLLAGTWDQFRDFTSPMDEEFAAMIGIAGHFQKDERTGSLSAGRNETDWFAYTIDASVEFGGANLFGSFIHHYQDNPAAIVQTFGFVGQAGMYFLPKWEGFARYEYAFFDLVNNGQPDLGILTLGVNYYIDGHDVKWTTDIGFGVTQVNMLWARSTPNDIAGYRADNDEHGPQITFRTQFQMLF